VSATQEALVTGPIKELRWPSTPWDAVGIGGIALALAIVHGLAAALLG
jgi:hypothetical protein